MVSYNDNNKQLNQTQNNRLGKNNSYTKIQDKKEDQAKYPDIVNKDNNNILNKNDINIKVVNSVLKKDMHGKPFLDYICEIKNGNDNYSLNKKFGHFILLQKNLKSLFKDQVKLPDGGNLFISINDMKQNTFHENKLSQLDKYINDLLKIEQVKNSAPFRNFFELDEQHEQNSNKIKRTKTTMDKKKFGRYSSNTLQRNNNEIAKDITNIK